MSVEVAGRWQPAREQRRDLTCPTLLRAGVRSWEALPCQTGVLRRGSGAHIRRGFLAQDTRVRTCPATVVTVTAAGFVDPWPCRMH